MAPVRGRTLSTGSPDRSIGRPRDDLKHDERGRGFSGRGESLVRRLVTQRPKKHRPHHYGVRLVFGDVAKTDDAIAQNPC